ncbi:hypothetical protein INT48_009765 [Thamnidium elegans]|uniref:Uncharacterized protein n=1 Tax=Thamnidium elegans TaxID=101142 RepID=A0A8H7STC5_9FUNG|nr:hypothetical protein INT48_009765 [Thamnidium elegans]
MRHMLLTRQLNDLERNTIFDDIIFGLDVTTLQMFDEIVDKCHDLNTLLIRISTTKSKLLVDNKRQSDGYKMLKVLDIVAENMDKQTDAHISELTFYRRFAMLLDFVFSDLDMTLDDSETIAEATKMAQQQSVQNVTSCFGRKIDLLLRIKDLKVGLASNEWKKTKHLYNQQQSKNFRINCSILNELFIRSSGKRNTISTLLPTDIAHLDSFKKDSEDII